MKRQVPFVQYKKEPQLAASFRSMLTAISIAGALAGAALFYLSQSARVLRCPTPLRSTIKETPYLAPPLRMTGSGAFLPRKQFPNPINCLNFV
ncbi:hypothetical protein [Treponema phagedenis]|uniref:hypothetical protein n=1 Tax=Treponema phagedenis TaxID=162 RepID=UPI0011ECB0CF|nr:hypothetical protein [Treponema phagedenis]TYT77672.1 hypothetical protein FS559_00250 [Treponema phagedenis]